LVHDEAITNEQRRRIEGEATNKLLGASFADYAAGVLETISQMAAARATFELLKTTNPLALFGLAAATGAAATALRGVASSQREQIQAEIEAARRENEEEKATAKEDEEARSREFGGSVQIKDTIINISPVVDISGEIVVIGNTGVEELTDTIGQIAVRSVKDAVETGEINLSPVGSLA